MDKLTKHISGLPVKPDDLKKWILIGKAKLQVQILAIKAINKVEEGIAARESALSDTQDLAEMLLYAEARLGEMLKTRPTTSSWEGTSRPLPPDITKKDSHFAQELNRNINIIPDIIDEARERGEVPLRLHVIRKGVKENIKKKMDNIIQRETEIITDDYDVIVIDPPWEMKKIDRDITPNQTDFDYPTMNEGDLKNLNIPAADNCHIWLWSTHKHLPMAFRLLEHWGLKYVCTFVWHKPGGFQPFGLPQYNCEFILYARKGTPLFIELKAFPVCFCASRTKHSEKPEEFYATIRRVTPGKRLDMFNRRKIDGFVGWGNESNDG